MDIVQIIIWLTVLLFSVILHEVSHGYVAYRLGDPTAKFAGRLTMNPVPHIDPVMSILVPALLILSQAGFIFGGAKPVPINPGNFKNYRRDMMIASIAGPAANVGLVIVSIILLKITKVVPAFQIEGLIQVLFVFLQLNVVLLVFNMFPIPPLDGSKVLAYFLPRGAAAKYEKMEKYGFIILIALLLIFPEFIFGFLKFFMYLAVSLV
ncbi:MAG: site-2 protease family protein [Candidatus Goldiibacteriota bacterium]